MTEIDVDVEHSIVVQTGNGTVPYKFSMSRAVYVAKVQKRGYIYRASLYATFESYITDDTTKFTKLNATASANLGATDTDSSSDPAGRKLLQQQSNPDPALAGATTVMNGGQVYNPTDPASSPAGILLAVANAPIELHEGYQCGPVPDCSQGDTTTSKLFPVANKTQALCELFFADTTSSNYSRCLRGPNFDRYNAIVGDIQQTGDDLTEWAQTLYQDANATTVADEGLLRLQLAQTNFTATINDRVFALQHDDDQTNEQLDQTMDYATEELTTEEATLTIVNRDLASVALNISRFANASESEAQELYRQTVDGWVRVAQTVAAAITTQKNTDRRMFSYIRQQQRNQLGVGTAYERIVRDETLIRAQTTAFHKIDAAVPSGQTVTGEVLRAFIPQYEAIRKPANDPTNLDAAYSSAPTFDVTTKYLVPTPYGYATRLRIRCNSLDVIPDGVKNPSFRDLVEWIGPPGCDFTFSDPITSKRCKCAGQVLSDLRCLMKNTAGVLSPADQAIWRAGTAADMSANVSCLLDAEQVPGGMTGWYLTSLTNVTNFLMTISSRGDYNNNGYQLYSRYEKPGVVFNARWSAGVSNITNMWKIMDEPPVNNMTNLAYALMGKAHESSYVNAYKNFDVFNSVIHGDLPNGLHHEPILWRNTSEGPVYRGVSSGVMYYAAGGDNMLTVSTVVMDTVVVNVQGFVGTSNVSTAVLGSFVDLYSGLLPARENIVWDPLSNQYIWDTVADDVPVVNRYTRRDYSIVAAMIPERHMGGYENTSYLAEHDFNQEGGGYSVEALRAEIGTNASSPDYKRCTALSRAPGGGHCTIRDHYLITNVGVFDDADVLGEQLLSPDEFTVTFTDTLPDGDVVIFATSECPFVTFNGQVNTGSPQMTITIRNPAGAANTFRIRQVGACPSVVTPDPTLEAHQTITITRTACSQAPPGQPDILTFQYQDKNGVFQNCAKTVTLNLTATDVRTFQGAATLGEAFAVENHVSSILFAEQARATLNIRRAIAKGILHDMNLLRLRNITTDPDATRARLAQLQQIIRDIGQANRDTLQQIPELKRNLSQAYYNGTAQSFPGADPNLAYANSVAQQQQLVQQGSDALDAALVEQRALPAKIANVAALGNTTVATFQAVVIPHIVKFSDDMLGLVNETVLRKDLLGQAALLSSNLTPGKIKSAGKFLGGTALDSLVTLFGDSNAARYTGFIFWVMILLNVVLFLPQFLYWVVFRASGKGRYVWPFSPWIMYEVDRILTEREKRLGIPYDACRGCNRNNNSAAAAATAASPADSELATLVRPSI